MPTFQAKAPEHMAAVAFELLPLRRAPEQTAALSVPAPTV
jgi:hypothetical protein